MKRNSIFLYLFLFVILLGGLYFKYNADVVYAKIGDFYYKNNCISEAQTFYEKSFSYGNTNSSIRENYVNSIITAPLDLEAQEKLVKIIESGINDKANYIANSFLNELRKEILNKYSNNYIKQAPYNQKIVRWNKFPITYSFCNQENVPEYYVSEIRQAFLDWEKSGDLMFSETTENADIKVKFSKIPNYLKMQAGKKYVVAYTVPIVNSTTLLGMNITFYDKSPEGDNYTNNQVYNTALHEIFHALGFMGHSFNQDDIMFYTKDNNTLMDDSRAILSDADIETQKLLYKIKPDITNQDELKSDYIPYLIFGNLKSVADSKMREAKKYISKVPNLPSGYIDLAESYVAKKMYPEAINSLERAYQVADTDEIKQIIFYNLAVSYFYIGHLDMALDYLSRAQDINDNYDIHYLKAEILLKKDFSKAEQEYLYLITQCPTDINYVLRLANVYVQKKSYFKARKILKNFTKINPIQRNDERLKPYRVLLF